MSDESSRAWVAATSELLAVVSAEVEDAIARGVSDEVYREAFYRRDDALREQLQRAAFDSDLVYALARIARGYRALAELLDRAADDLEAHPLYRWPDED